MQNVKWAEVCVASETKLMASNVQLIFDETCFFFYYRSQDLYRRLGSPTVSAVGSHSAMVRYIPTDKTDKRITDKEIYLLNAATQYKGT